MWVPILGTKSGSKIGAPTRNQIHRAICFFCLGSDSKFSMWRAFVAISAAAKEQARPQIDRSKSQTFLKCCIQFALRFWWLNWFKCNLTFSTRGPMPHNDMYWPMANAVGTAMPLRFWCKHHIASLHSASHFRAICIRGLLKSSMMSGKFDIKAKPCLAIRLILSAGHSGLDLLLAFLLV